MKFQRELAWDIWEEVVPLLIAHYKEISRYPDIRLNPDMDFYYRAEEQGMLRVYTARNGVGLLCGYAIYFVKPNPHYKDSLQAVQDILFLHPVFRQGLTGLRLIKYADQQLQAEGVQVVYQHVKVYKDFGPVLERLGYHQVEKIYARRLDHGSVNGNRSGSGGRGSVRGKETGTETASLDGAGPAGSTEARHTETAGSPGGSDSGGEQATPADAEFARA